MACYIGCYCAVCVAGIRDGKLPWNESLQSGFSDTSSAPEAVQVPAALAVEPADKAATGLRYNAGKPRMSLIDGDAMLELARVLTFGAAKYAAHNWRKGLLFSETIDSLERHVAELKARRSLDGETGLLHVAHIMCNAMFLTYFMLNYSKYQKFDDRYQPPSDGPK